MFQNSSPVFKLPLMFHKVIKTFSFVTHHPWKYRVNTVNTVSTFKKFPPLLQVLGILFARIK